MRLPNLLLHPHRVFRHTWDRRHLQGGKRFYLEVLIFGLTLVALPYLAVNHLMAGIGVTVWDPEFAIDRMIPVIPWMIIPYASLFLLNPLPIFVHPQNDRGRMELLMALQAIGTLTIISCVFFILLPAKIDLRDQIPVEIMTGGGGIIGYLYKHLHLTDNPWNAWPSLHISQSVVLMMVLTRWLKRDWAQFVWAKPVTIVLWLNWVLLCISVLTTKQHYVWDLATGLALGMFWWSMLNVGFQRLDAIPEDEISSDFKENLKTNENS